MVKQVQACIDARGHHFQHLLLVHSDFPNYLYIYLFIYLFVYLFIYLYIHARTLEKYVPAS